MISASALSLLYPADGIHGDSREAAFSTISSTRPRRTSAALSTPAPTTSRSTSPRRLSLKLDPSGGLLGSFVDLNNRVLDRFSARRTDCRIGVTACPGGDHDSTHSADVDYGGMLPLLFDLHAGTFYLELAGEADPEAGALTVAGAARPAQRVFVGVTNPIDPEVETPEQVRDRVLLAAKHIPIAQLGNDRRLRLLTVCR